MATGQSSCIPLIDPFASKSLDFPTSVLPLISLRRASSLLCVAGSVASSVPWPRASLCCSSPAATTYWGVP
ncbi:Transmembrane protein 235 [Manis javanica]|nr:Transmembrane protein 235 [Manis javanica]